MLDMKQLDVAEREIGRPVEQLLTPLSGYLNARPDARFGIDNGAFSRFDEGRFVRLLKRERPRRHLCRFVALPDVVGSARRTLECFDYWTTHRRRELAGWPLALVCQDGQEDLPIPWERIAAVFIGGTTTWKLSAHAEHIIKAAKVLGRWAHVGRVNTPERLRHFAAIGADSFDGTGVTRYSWMREAIANAEEPAAPLFDATETLAA